jgi:hypothetical protein
MNKIKILKKRILKMKENLNKVFVQFNNLKMMLGRHKNK